MKRVAMLIYGTTAYMLFAGCLLYAIGFVGDFGVPKTINSGAAGPLTDAILIDCLLLSLFAVQHSGMARKRFKEVLTRVVPKEMERSTFVYATCAVLFAMFTFWRPIPGAVWETNSAAFAAVMQGLSLTGWATVLVATINIHHFDLFGLRQAWLAFRGEAYKDLGFRTPGLYKLVRHPIYVGFFLAFWATPTMTYGHLLFAVMCTGYVVFAVKMFEEPGLMREHGQRYLTYMNQVGGFIPKKTPAARERELTPTA